MSKINYSRLRSMNACATQLDAFWEVFQDKDVPLTISTAVEHAQTFDWEWASQHLLDSAHDKLFMKAADKVDNRSERLKNEARKSAERAIYDAIAAYLHTSSCLTAEYEAAIKPARDEFKQVTEPFRDQVIETVWGLRAEHIQHSIVEARNKFVEDTVDARAAFHSTIAGPKADHDNAIRKAREECEEARRGIRASLADQIKAIYAQDNIDTATIFATLYLQQHGKEVQ